MLREMVVVPIRVNEIARDGIHEVLRLVSDSISQQHIICLAHHPSLPNE
jgi:hypothetical protein